MQCIDELRQIQEKIRRGGKPTFDEINANWAYLDNKTKNDGYLALRKMVMASVRANATSWPLQGAVINIDFLAIYSSTKIRIENISEHIYLSNIIERNYRTICPLYQIYILRNGLYGLFVSERRRFLLEAHASKKVINQRLTQISSATKTMSRINFIPKCCDNIHGKTNLKKHLTSRTHLEIDAHQRLLLYSEHRKNEQAFLLSTSDRIFPTD